MPSGPNYPDSKFPDKTRHMIISLLPVLFLFITIWSCQLLPEQYQSISTPPVADALQVDQKTNIHFTGKYCGECHEKTPDQGGIYLKFNGDYQLLCRCHPGQSPGYCHPLENISNSELKRTVPAEFPLTDGEFTCNTCHDIYRQCRKRLFDKYTLRGAPYARKTDFCYKCHDANDYRKLNVHRQIKMDGALDEQMCLYCHRTKPDEKTATFEQVTFIGGMRILCRRCHSIEGNHPGDFDHLATPPSAKALAHMSNMETQFSIILPLAKDKRMTCITCHNPHAKGTIDKDKPSAKGADTKYRERLPGRLCVECHQM